MSQVVDYSEVWRMWLDGNIELRDMTLWGLQIQWWGRVGKYLGIISACAILAEYISARRLREMKDDPSMWKSSVIPMAYGALVAPVGLVVNYVMCGTYNFLAKSHPTVFFLTFCLLIFEGVLTAAVLLGRLVVTARVVSFVLLLGSFHFDLLAS